jgi:hypothetical protein
MRKTFFSVISWEVGHLEIKRRWKAIIKIGLREIGYESRDLIKKKNAIGF